MSNDLYQRFNPAFNDPAMLQAPAFGVFAVTPSDAALLAIATRSIRANTAGTITVTGADGIKTLCNFLAGETRQIRALQIWATGTTATGIEGMY